jgi:hypothetical protein
MESTLVGIILSSVSQFSVVHVVFATSVALDDATDDKKKKKEHESENHADEPASSRDAVAAWWDYHDI